MTLYKICPDDCDPAAEGSEIEAANKKDAVRRYLLNASDETHYDGDDYQLLVLSPDGVTNKFFATCYVEITFEIEEGDL